MARASHCIYNFNMAGSGPKSSESFTAIRGFKVITLASSFESPGSTFGPFALDRYALTWIVEGGGATSLGDAPIATTPGTVLSMLPGMSLRHDWGSARSFQTFIVFDFAALPRGFPTPHTWPRSRQLAGDEAFLSLWRYLLAIDHGEPSTSALVARGAELLLGMFVSGLVDGQARTSPALPRAVERALDFMLDAIAHGNVRFELGAVAKAAGVTPQHLCRVFRRELDASPIECAHLMRVEQAASLLERSDQTLAELAERFGYCSAFHFSRVFKQIYGAPPSDYRRAFMAGRATRPGGLVFRHHRLRRYIYEAGPGRVMLQSR
jgi:AraC family transcriptional regulator